MDYTFSLTQQEATLILQALGELPLKMTVNVFAKLQNQLHEQDQANAMQLVPANKE